MIHRMPANFFANLIWADGFLLLVQQYASSSEHRMQHERHAKLIAMYVPPLTVTR
jgi:hypothetical protein